MNKLKRTFLGIAIAGLAFGFSAFSTYKSKNVLRYYKADWSNMDPNDPNGYQYFSADMCYPGGSLCSALWDLGLNLPPAEGEWLPLTGVMIVPGSVQTGHFEY